MSVPENNICPVCQKDSEFIYLELYRDRNQEYKLYFCPECQVQFWQPFKNPGAEWYEKDKSYSRRNIDPDLKPNVNHKRIINYLKLFKGAVLDVGCGTGNFLYYAKQNGWQVFGIDFDRDAVGVAKNVFHLENVEVSDLNAYCRKYPERTFDLVTFFDVFEHIDNHNEFIEDIKKILKNKGYIAASMPYRKMARWLNPGDWPPRHLTRWDRTSLKNFLEKHGFEILYLKRKSEGLMPIFTRLLRRYGKFFSFNIIGKYKKKVRGDKIIVGSRVERKISTIHRLAKIKDWLIFGIPTILIWVIMLFTPKRYSNLYVIARRK